MAMIAEVNNTFDERRIYILQEKKPRETLSDIALGATTEAESFEKCWFRQTWSKDFHVSPFNSRKGSYSLKARDPTTFITQQPADNQHIKKEVIEIIASLLSSKGHVKLVTCLSSVGAPLDPFQMSVRKFLLFFSSWWWIPLIKCESQFAIERG